MFPTELQILLIVRQFYSTRRSESRAILSVDPSKFRDNRGVNAAWNGPCTLEPPKVQRNGKKKTTETSEEDLSNKTRMAVVDLTNARLKK